MENELLANLDGGAPLGVMTVVRQCTERLRAGAWAPGLLGTLLSRLSSLSDHESPRVRQAVAESLPYLPDDALFEALVDKLEKDASVYVRNAAEASRAKRATLKKAEARHEEHDVRVANLYAQLDRRSRQIARSIAAHEREYYVRRMNHERNNLDIPLALSLAKLDELTGHHPEVAKLRELLRQELRLHEDARKNASIEEPSYRPENLRAIVESQAQELEGRAEVDLSGVDRRVEMEADATSLRQAFRNIMKNAVEAYETAERPITVSARTTDAEVVLIFADRGCGMDADQIGRACEPFGSSKPGGTGFGLFIARQAARLIHGGDLSIASEKGKGTMVTMRLPLRQETSRKKRRRKK